MEIVTIVAVEWLQKGDGSEIALVLSSLWLESVQRNSLQMGHLLPARAFFDPVILSSLSFCSYTHLLSPWPLSAIPSDHCHWNHRKGRVTETTGASRDRERLLRAVQASSSHVPRGHEVRPFSLTMTKQHEKVHEKSHLLVLTCTFREPYLYPGGWTEKPKGWVLLP